VDAARKIFEMAGLDFDELYQTAATRSFQPVPLGITAQSHLQNSVSTLDSANVVAKLKGTESPEDSIVFIAHWDHLGIDESLEGDQIFNGALDNASGTAGLLEIAEAFGRLEEKLPRTVLFLAVTAEEQGLLGSRYYAQNPLYPPGKTVAAVNMDGLNLWGLTRDVTVIGMGQSTLDELAARIAAEQGRVLRPDPEPEKGFYYRSDHFEFAKIGIPAFDADAGIEYINRPEGWGLEMRDRYTAEDYHKPSDEVKDDWDLSGAVEDLELFYRMGYELAAGTQWPTWSGTSEFRAIREQSRQ
jgi:Zn-dependent M28 family amino/carboxypeptidase